MTPSIAVVVVCHPAYEKWLKRCIRSIDAQSLKFRRKILVSSDWSEQKHYPNVPGDWVPVISEGVGPNCARNTGLQWAMNDCDWICFWDADNIMPPDYLAKAYGEIASAAKNIGVIYPATVATIDEDGRILHEHKMPEWSYRAAQTKSLCDSASFWRTEAVCEVGGWEATQTRHDDYTLALRIFRASWRGKRFAGRLELLMHGDNRSRTNDLTESLWKAYSFAFVLLYSGSGHDGIEDWLVDCDIPPNSNLYIVNNSGDHIDPDSEILDRFRSVTIVNAGKPYETVEGETYRDPGRHRHVAYLYNQVFPMIREEIIVCIEDDMVPPKDGIKTLLREFTPGSNVALAAGVYRSRPSPEYICASRDKKTWRDAPKFDQLPNKTFEVGMTGCGFALIANWALQECLPVFCEVTPDGRMMGWDGNLGLALTERGYKLLAVPSVKCQHLCPQVIAYEKGDIKSFSSPDCYGGEPYGNSPYPY